MGLMIYGTAVTIINEVVGTDVNTELLCQMINMD